VRHHGTDGTDEDDGERRRQGKDAGSPGSKAHEARVYPRSPEGVRDGVPGTKRPVP